MEIYKPSLRNFLPSLERTEPILVDHTALYAAKQCLRKYFYFIVLGRVPKLTAPYFIFGSAYHKFREVLETTNEPSPITVALPVAVKYFTDRIGSVDLVPGSKYDYMTAERLVECCEVAYEHWQKEKQDGLIEVISSEQSFNVQLFDGSFRSGRADQILRWNGDIWGRDFKTSSQPPSFYSRNLDPNDQFIGYTLGESKLVGQRVKGQLIEVLFNQKGKDPEIQTFPVQYSNWQLTNYEKECVQWNKILTMCREEDLYPMSHSGCWQCSYKELCKRGSEDQLLWMLENEFDYHPWDSTMVHLEG